VLLIFRLWQLQIMQGETFDRLSDKNRIRLRRVPFTRGIIYDHGGNILADNRPAFNLMGVPAEIPEPRSVIDDLQRGVALEGRRVVSEIEKADRGSPFRALKLKGDLPWDEVAWVETHRLDLPGIWVEVEPRRFYPHNSIAAHLLGYVGEITEDQLKRRRNRGYRVGDRIGKSGLEWTLEHYLRGQDGGLQVEVDARGRQLMVLQQVPFQPGANALLTLDIELQEVTEEALGDRAGAVIAGDPNTGEILAMVSHPAYDPNLFSSGISTRDWQELLKDPRHPLQNRVIMAQYPPGSVYKIVTALAGLEEHVITPKTKLFCPGHYKLGDREFSCWKEAGHGWLNLHQAIVQSCDVFFYQVGERLGVNRIAEYAKRLGLGQPTGFDPEREKPGLIPTADWKRSRFGLPWHAGETLSVAIGQGFDLITPLQAFVMISAVANGGTLVVPQVVDQVKSANGKILVKDEPKTLGRVQADPENLRIIRDALQGAVQGVRGTGHRARVEGVQIAGKTGTAQVVGYQGKDGDDTVPYEFRDHAWFVCFAPAEKPQIALSILVEHGGHGGAEAAPIAQRILQAFFNKERRAAED
jgi:penicillin-binding protein 2